MFAFIAKNFFACFLYDRPQSVLARAEECRCKVCPMAHRHISVIRYAVCYCTGGEASTVADLCGWWPALAKYLKARPFGRPFGSAVAAAVVVRKIVGGFIPIVDFFQAAQIKHSSNS